MKKPEDVIALGRLKKYIGVFLCSGMGALLVFCLLLYISIGGVTAYSPEALSDYNQKVRYNVDSVEVVGNHLILVGWAFVPGENIEMYQIHILLRSLQDGQYLKLPTAMQRRSDVTELFHNPESETNFNYDMSGWHARANINRLNPPLEQYEIIILYQNNNRHILVETERKVEMQ